MRADKWGCPDWRDADAYPLQADDLEDWQWRWEFLKRSPEYRQAWQNGEPREQDNWRTLHPTDLEYSRTVWGLPGLPDPKTDFRGSSNIFTKRAGGIISFMAAEHPYVELLREKVIALGVFDLRAPIKPQIKTVEHILKEAQKHQHGKLTQFKQYRNYWPRHLRVIDAEDQGATDTEIFEQFESELIEDRDAYDNFGGAQPLAMIADWRKAARATMEKAALFL